MEIPDFLISKSSPPNFPVFHPASSGQKISITIVEALKSECIVIVAQRDPVRSWSRQRVTAKMASPGTEGR